MPGAANRVAEKTTEAASHRDCSVASSAAHSASVNSRDRVRKRSPSGPSGENIPPRPGFLRAHAGSEVAGVVDGERHVGEGRLADRLAVVPGFGGGEHREVLLHPVGDPVQDVGTLGGRGLAPRGLGLVRGVERAVDCRGCRAGNLAERLAGDRSDTETRHSAALQQLLVLARQAGRRLGRLRDVRAQARRKRRVVPGVGQGAGLSGGRGGAARLSPSPLRRAATPERLRPVPVWHGARGRPRNAP